MGAGFIPAQAPPATTQAGKPPFTFNRLVDEKKMNTVENLTKVCLLIEAGTTADSMDLTQTALEYEFIFGIGSGGMCPFEYQMVNKAAGDEIGIQLNKEERYRLFEHLSPPIENLFENHDVLHLRIRILRIEKPENTEVIKALSKMTSHHHDCDCGCGC